MEEAPSDLAARWKRQSASSPDHERLVLPRPTDTHRPGTSPTRGPGTDSSPVLVVLEHARRQHTVACETSHRRRQRLQLNQRRVDDVDRAEREAAAVLVRAEWVAGQHAQAGDSVAVATSTSPVRVCHVHYRSERPGNEAFFDGSVSYMASAELNEVSAELRTAAVKKAPALLTSVRCSSFQSPGLLSVRQAWSDTDHSSWSGQQKGGPTLALIIALRRAHDETETPVLWPTPQEAQEELRRTK